MRRDVARDLRRSSQAFVDIVWPNIRHLCRKGELRPVETVVSDEFERQLDILAGVDAWQVMNGYGIRPIATRVQFPKPTQVAWRSFTVRHSRPTKAKTEWEKRAEAILKPELGLLRPALTIQAYIRKERLSYACIVRSDDLYRFAKPEYRGGVWTMRQNPADGVSFAAFWAAGLREHGVPVWEWPAETPDAAQKPAPAVLRMLATGELRDRSRKPPYGYSPTQTGMDRRHD